MLRTLYREPEHGFLGAQTFLHWRGIALVQYWRSFDDLERFARDPGEAHLPNWRRFNRAVGGDGSVGIWHESYLVDAGRYEAVVRQHARVRPRGGRRARAGDGGGGRPPRGVSAGSPSPPSRADRSGAPTMRGWHPRPPSIRSPCGGTCAGCAPTTSGRSRSRGRGAIGAYPLFWGEEGVQAGAAAAVRETDWLFLSYRQNGLPILRGLPVEQAWLYFRGDPQGFFDPVPYACAPQAVPIATHLPHAVGWAWEQRRQGGDGVAVAFFGDGATSEGDFSEALNLAGVLSAPVVFLLHQQPVGHLHAVRASDRGRDHRRQGGRLRHARRDRRRLRRPRGRRRGRARGGPGTRRQRPNPGRGTLLPHQGARDRRRPDGLPQRRRGVAVGGA